MISILLRPSCAAVYNSLGNLSVSIRFHGGACPPNGQIMPGAPCNVEEVLLESVSKLYSETLLY